MTAARRPSASPGVETFAISASRAACGRVRRPRSSTDGDGRDTRFRAIARIDGEAEVEYFRHGGILQMVLRQMLAD